MICHSVILDKIDLLQALDFGSDLKKLTYTPSYRCIFTTTDQRSESAKSSVDLDEYKEIKRHFMGSE